MHVDSAVERGWSAAVSRLSLDGVLLLVAVVLAVVGQWRPDVLWAGLLILCLVVWRMGKSEKWG
jgi:hypothetical protein